MSPASDGTNIDGTGFPRVSGDEPGVDDTREDREEFSPRERG